VQTRWYRAPELLCETDTYDPQIDVWSVGCIFAEMLRRKPFFRGETPQHQLETIVSVIGLPSPRILDAIKAEPIRKALFSGAEAKPYPFKSYFPRDVNPVRWRRMKIFVEASKFLNYHARCFFSVGGKFFRLTLFYSLVHYLIVCHFTCAWCYRLYITFSFFPSIYR